MIRANIRVTGDDDFIRQIERMRRILDREVPKGLLAFSMHVVNITKKDYLTDEGRIYSNRWYRRPDGSRYRPVLNYPRPKIGVLTGRLRASYGADNEDGIREIRQHGWFIRVGTNVDYAPYVARRKYDFAKLGAEDAERRYLNGIIMHILRSLTNV